MDAKKQKIQEMMKQLTYGCDVTKKKSYLSLLTDLKGLLQDPDCPAAIIPRVVKALAHSLDQYQCTTVRDETLSVIRTLCLMNSEKAVTAILDALNKVAQFQVKNAAPSRSQSARSLLALSWACLLIELALKKENKMTFEIASDNATCRSLLGIQASLHYGTCAAENIVLIKSANRKLTSIWKKIGNGVFDLYFDSFLKSEMTMPSCGLLASISAFDSEAFLKKKQDYFDIYVKIVIMSKTKPLASLLKSCETALKFAKHEEFDSLLLPAVQKALLRSPENVLLTITSILRGVTIDLSQHSLNISKYLTQILVSKNDEMREHAVTAIHTMATQMSDASMMEEVAKHFFGVLKGSEGKLTVAGQKMDIIAALGKLSFCSVSKGPSMESLVTTMTDGFSAFLLQDNYEPALVNALGSLSMWCAKLTTNVPKNLTELFKKGPTLKASTSAVRTAYIECMLSTYKTDTLEQAGAYLTTFLATVDKASGQSMQIPLVCEALSASHLIAKLSGTEFKIADSKLANFWSVVLDAEKGIFVSEKFFQQATEPSLLRLASFSEYLFLEQMPKLSNANISQYCSALMCLLMRKEWKIRNHAQKSVKKVLNSLAGDSLLEPLLSEFSKVLSVAKLLDLEILEDNSDVLKSYVPPKLYVSALNCLLKAPGIGSDKEKANKIALLVLKDCHHPVIQAGNPNIWTDFLYSNAHLDAAEYVESNIDKIIEIFAMTTKHDESTLCVLSNLTRIAPQAIMPKILEFAKSTLNDPAVVSITNNEFGILNTPEGELYNKSIIESGPKVVENKNIKRENKAYSYKEQMEFLELQKEMEAKKKAKGGGGVKGPGGSKSGSSQPLSKKQREMKEAELKKESQIRSKYQQIDENSRAAFAVLTACIDQQNCGSLDCYIPELVELVLPLLDSLLVSKPAQQLFVKMRNIVNCEAFLKIGIQVAYATLRLRDPIHEVDENWTEENLTNSASRLTFILHSASKIQKKLNPEDVPFSSECFCYFFPFLELVLRDAGAKAGVDEKITFAALEIIKIHSRRASDGSGAEHMPRHRMISCLRKLIGITGGKLQQLSCETFNSTCEAIAKMGKLYSDIQSEVDELLQCLLSPTVTLRVTALQGLSTLVAVLPSGEPQDEISETLLRRLWVAKHDIQEECQEIAEKLWSMLLFSTSESLCTSLLSDITHHEPGIQQAAADALYSALEENQDAAPQLLALLIKLYSEKSHQPPPVLDDLGRVVSQGGADDYQSRIGIGKALCSISPVLSKDEMQSLFSFFVPDALKDRNAEVRAAMLEAALQAVNDHGKNCTNTLLQVFEDFLKQAPNSESFDTVRQSVVILMGTLARHLDKDNPKVKPIVAKLTETLSTPSQPVQEAVAKCLPPLVPAIKADAPDIVKKMLMILLESENYGERKGAAYGLAGMIKGLGIIAFKQLDVMNTLTEAIQDKKNYRHREGALFAFEMFCTMLGRLFEPYVVHVLPYLLLCFGDGNQYVREAADETARAVMKNLTAHGVKLVLPSLLSALEEDSWRTKTGSVELLGAMAYCAPKQLSSCLPSVVPRLCEIITDSHPKVQKAGQQALKQIGSVIRNPEILSIAPVLLSALSDPFRKTSKCLQTLLDTKFVHFIDAPSLALIMPVVHRAFEDRSTDTRRMAAQIIGNMYSLTDQKDLNPYLPSVVPGLKNTLLDPVPDVRTVAAKALGAMVKGTGESLFEELLPWLMETLTSEQSSVDRSGSAQGLAEVLGALGVKKLEKLMPDIIRMAGSAEVLPHVRDGYIMLYIYFPSTFGDDFTPFIGDIIPALLQSLADECEFLRDTALLAGQRIIGMYAQQAVALLLPQLESGLFDDNWRIRLSSIQLLGELLYQVSGVTGKMTTHGDEDDNFGTMEGQKAIREVLGEERCYRVFSGLYIGRSDVMLQVRQSALHVWKIVVPNTPRVLREILPVLFELLLGCLASSSYDKRQVAARTLGDLVRKLGERMLPEIIPILESELASDDGDQRQGVCIGLSEIIGSCSKDAILQFADDLVPTVRKALCDTSPDVRVAAASTFENLHNSIGHQALEEILPDLLEHLGDPDISDNVVDGLRQVIAIKGKVVMPFIVPKLIQPPINTEVLSFLSSVAGEALTRHLSKILKALLSALVSESEDQEKYSSTLEDCKGVILSVEGEHGNRIIMDDLLEATKSEQAAARRASVTLLGAFCQDTDSDYSTYVSMFIRVFFKLLADPDTSVQEESWSALGAVVKRLDAAEQLQHVSSVRQAIRYASDEIQNNGGILPGMCMPKKGVAPVLPILREGLLNGAPDMKEQAAKTLTECVKVLTPEALKPSVVSVTGPLIRILGDRFNANVRVAVLETLTLLLEKAGAFLKPFLPQLQTTFSKALHDANRSVRLQSAKALKHLVLIHTRLDPLFTDLNNSIKSEEDSAIKETMLHAMRGCIAGGGAKMNPKIQNEILATLTGLLNSDEETCCKCAAGCLGALCNFLPDDVLDQFLSKTIFVKDLDASWSLRQGRSTVLAVALKESATKVFTSQREEKCITALLQYAALDRVQIVANSIRTAAYLLVHCVKSSSKIPSQIKDCFKMGFQHSSNDVKVISCEGVAWAARTINSDENSDLTNGSHFPSDVLTFCIGQLLLLAKEKNVTVRSTAELSLVTILSLRKSEKVMQDIQPSLPTRDSNSLSELFKTRLKKLVAMKDVVEDIDDTLVNK